MRSLTGPWLVAVAAESFSVHPSRHGSLVQDFSVRPRVTTRCCSYHHCLFRPLTERTKSSCSCSGDGPDTNDATVTNTVELTACKVKSDELGLGEQRGEGRPRDYNFASNERSAPSPQRAAKQRDIPSIPDAILLCIEPPELRQDLINWRARWNDDGREIQPSELQFKKNTGGETKEAYASEKRHEQDYETASRIIDVTIQVIVELGRRIDKEIWKTVPGVIVWTAFVMDVSFLLTRFVVYKLLGW
jgi:hypothetical protein